MFTVGQVALYVPGTGGAPPGDTRYFYVWDGADWVPGVLKVWDGASWLAGNPQVWDGTQWLPSGSAGSGDDDYLTTYLDHGNVTTTKTIDITDAGVQAMTLTSASCTLTINGTPASGFAQWCTLHLIHDATTNARAVVWPSSILWGNNTEPILDTTTASVVGVVTILTLPDGTRFGYHSGNMS